MRLLSEPEPARSVAGRSHSLLEAPCEVEGGLAYSDVLGGGVYALRPDGAVDELLPKRRGVGGMAAHRDGGFVASGRSLVHVRDGVTRDLFADDEATGFNDLAADAAGAVVAGMLRYNPLGGEPAVPGAAVRVDAPDSAIVLAEGITWPNGIAFSPDGATTYIADYATRQVLAFPSEGGTPDVFAESPRGSADGVAVDAEGGVWVALGEGGIARFTPGGELDAMIDVGAAFVSSLCFAGRDRRDVWITTWDALLHARSEVPGLPVHLAGV